MNMLFNQKKKAGVRLFLGVIFLVLFFFMPMLQSGRVFCFRDIPRYFYPLKFFGASQLQQGRMPLWNPLLFCGMPFFANLQSAVLYPVSLVCNLLSFPYCFNLYVILHFILAGFFMALLARDWTGRNSSAFLSAVTFTFGGFLVSVIDMNSTLSAVVWLPLAVLLFKRVLGARPAPYFFCGSLVLGLVFLGGEPTVFVETFFLLLTLVLFLPHQPEETVCRRSDGLVRLVLFFSLALGVVACQVFPFMELLGRSLRSQGTPMDNAMAWSLPPKHLLTFLFPFLFGSLKEANHYTGQQLWLNSFYIGILPFILCLVALKKESKKDVLWLWFVALTGLVLSLGAFTPVYPWLYEHSLIFKWIRYPIKFMLLTSFSLSLLAGIGWDQWQRQSLEFKRTLTNGLVILVCLGLILFLVLNLGRESIIRVLIHGKKYSLEQIYFSVQQYNQYLDLGLRTLGMFAAVTLLAFLVQRVDGAGKLAGLLAVCLVFGDLYTVHHDSFHTASPEFYTQPPAVLAKLTQEGRVYLTKAAEDKGHVIFADTYDQALEQAKQCFFANTLSTFGVSYVTGYDSLTRQDYEQYTALLEVSPLEKSRLLDLSNARYVVSTTPLQDKKFNLVYQGPSLVYENKGALARVFGVGRAVTIKSRMAVLKAMSSPDFDPSRTVILEQGDSEGASGTAWPKPALAEVMEDQGDQVRLGASMPDNGWVVLGDSYYPGWQAQVNGKPAAVLRANGSFRAVAVPKGLYEIVLSYEPVWFKRGLWVSGAALLLCFAGGLSCLSRPGSCRRKT